MKYLLNSSPGGSGLKYVAVVLTACWFNLLTSAVAAADAGVTIFHRQEQKTFTAPDYRNAIPLGSTGGKISPPEVREAATRESSRRPVSDTTEARSWAGQRGTGRLSPERLYPAEEMSSVDQSPEGKVAKDADGSLSPQEYGDGGGIPFTTTRVEMYGMPISRFFPYSSTGKLFMRDGSQTLTCSAVVVLPGIIATAAQCVGEYGSAEFYTDFEFVPAFRNGLAPFGTWKYENVVAGTAYIKGTSDCIFSDGTACEDNVALLELETREDGSGYDYPIGLITGFPAIGLGGYGFSNEDAALITALGYPESHDHGQTMQRTDSLAFVDESSPDILVMGSRFTEGAAGGPWFVNFGQRASLSQGVSAGNEAGALVVIGVTSLDYSDVPGYKMIGGIRFTSENFEDLVDELCPFGTSNVNCYYDFPTQLRRDTDIIVNLEEPVDDAELSGIGNLRGWAVSEYGIAYIEIYIDGEYAFDAPYGGSRSDVGAAFPEYPDAYNSGFGLAYGYSNLSVGTHEIMVRAIDSVGRFDTDVATFEVTAFHKNFIAPGDEVNVSGSSVQKSQTGFWLRGVDIDGQPYDLRFEWQTASQDFDIVEIDPQ